MVDKRRQSRFVVGGAGAAVLLWSLGGCGGWSARDVLPRGGERLSADDFHGAGGVEGAGARPIPVFVPEQRRAARVEIRSVTEAEARGGVSGIDTRVGEPVLDGRGGQIVPPAGAGDGAGAGAVVPEPVDSTGLTLVDAKVGDLNGLPILAGDWLEPMGARLRAESAGKTREQWRKFAAEAIEQELVGDLRDELFLSEARSSLTAQQKAGLRVFLKRFEKDVVRGSYGSQTLADEQLRQRSGFGLDEALRERERAALIQTQVQQKVWDRVQVPQRDLVLAYEKDYAKYNPKARAVFRQIRVSSGEAGTVREFGERLASGGAFAEVAADERNGTPEETVREFEGSLAETELYGREDLQAAAASLEPGQMAGPIDTGSFTYWIYLDRIERESHALYEVQRELRDQLTAERREEEARRYLLQLFERAGIAGLDELVFRLVFIAERWYFEDGAG
ncbi:MAG: peptidyl-prolyl cis-trans isomerase [Phycisphaerales bacterium]|nr:peptidyl-prolyl cis-trans isomerase [Phycisphaerales bacterium]